jgi:hypothetical protein
MEAPLPPGAPLSLLTRWTMPGAKDSTRTKLAASYWQ